MLFVFLPTYRDFNQDLSPEKPQSEKFSLFLFLGFFSRKVVV